MEIRLLNKDLEKFIESLEKSTIAKVLKTIDLLEQFGHNLKLPHSKKIEKIFDNLNIFINLANIIILLFLILIIIRKKSAKVLAT